MQSAPTKANIWTVVGLGLATWLWSLALPDGDPPLLWWGLAAGCGLMLGLLILRWPAYGAALAAGVLALLPAVGPWSNAGHWAAAAVMGLIALRWWADALRGHRQWNPRFDLPVLLTFLWVGWQLVAAFGSPSATESIPHAVRPALVVAGGLASGHYLGLSKEGRKWWLFSTGSALLLVTAWAWVRWPDLFKAAPMPFWQDANLFSAGLAFVLPLVLWSTLSNQATNPWSKAPGLLAATAMLASIFWFNSRGAWISLAIAGVATPALVVASRKWRLVLTAAGLAVILAAGFVTRGKSVDAHHQEPLARLGSITNTTDFSNRERLQRWTCAWRMALEKPITGHGPGRFAPLFKNYLKDRGEANQIAWWFGWRFSAHSDALTTMSEAGFPALILFVAAILAWAWQAARQHWRRPERPLRSALLLALATWLVHGQVNDLLSSPAILAWVFLAMGMLATLPEAGEAAGRD